MMTELEFAHSLCLVFIAMVASETTESAFLYTDTDDKDTDNKPRGKTQLLTRTSVQ